MKRDFILNYLAELEAIMRAQRDYLIELDQICGDGDLGLTMSDGFSAASAAAAASDEKDIGLLLYQAGKAMAQAVPSTMGTLMASGLMQAGKALKGRTELELPELVELFAAWQEGVEKRGKARIGEKTFLDGIDPAVQALRRAAAAALEPALAAVEAARAAHEGFESTVGLLARHGRAATRGEASRALRDPGAAVAMFIFYALKKTLNPS